MVAREGATVYLYYLEWPHPDGWMDGWSSGIHGGGEHAFDVSFVVCSNVLTSPNACALRPAAKLNSVCFVRAIHSKHRQVHGLFVHRLVCIGVGQPVD